MLEDFYPNLENFTWNSHEACHGKGAPDGVGATCKRIADRQTSCEWHRSLIDDLVNAPETNCTNIKVFTIDDADISEKVATLGSTEGIKTFLGTLKVHKVTGLRIHTQLSDIDEFELLCDTELYRHFQLGTLDYPPPESRLRVDDLYGASDSEYEPISRISSQELHAKPQEIVQLSITTTSMKTKRHKHDPTSISAK